MIWLGLALVLAGIAILPFRREARRKVMDADARKEAPGDFVTLSDGVTHYQWIGPTRGPVVVCIHGLTTPSFVWHGLAPILNGLGYRVLIYDLFGRGYSDRPKGAQTRAFFLRQLTELLASQGLREDLTVFGYSMGGAIATGFAAAHPGMIRQVVLLAPAGIRMPKLGISTRISRWPGIGEWLMLLTYPSVHHKGCEAERTLPSSVPGIVDLQQAELGVQGFTPAVLSSFRGILSENFEDAHRQIAAQGLPMLVILGEEDPLIPPSVAGPLVAWHRLARVEVIAGAGHGLTYTHTAEIGAHVTAFLRDLPE